MESLQAEVGKLDSAKNELVSSLDVVRTANANIEDLAKELKTSQTAQDEELKSIRDNSKALTNKADTINATVNKIDEALSTQEKSITQLVQSLNAANTALSGISPLIQTVQTAISNQLDRMSVQIVTDIQKMQHSNNEMLAKMVGTLQIISIIQLVVSVAIIVLLMLK